MFSWGVRFSFSGSGGTGGLVQGEWFRCGGGGGDRRIRLSCRLKEQLELRISMRAEFPVMSREEAWELMRKAGRRLRTLPDPPN